MPKLIKYRPDCQITHFLLHRKHQNPELSNIVRIQGQYFRL